MNASLFARLAEGFPADRGRTLIETGDRRAVSFAEVLDQAGRMVALLRASGVEPGDRVAVRVETSVASVALYLAVLQAGAVHVPLNPACTPAELGHLLKDAEPKAVVCDPAAAAAVSPLVAEVAWLFTLGADGAGSLTAQAARLPSERAVAPRAGDDLAAILYTSGAAGRPKGAMLTNDNLWSTVAALHRLWGFRPDDVLIHALPLYHAQGLSVALNLMLINGGRLILLPRFDAEQVIACMPRATVLIGVPTFYARLLANERLTRETAAGMRLFVSGSARLPTATQAAFEARTGRRILECYGMTETGMIAANPFEGERRAGTVGLALPGVSLRVCDGDGAELPAGEVGGLEVRGPNVFAGYWRMPEETAKEMREGGWFVTGDLAKTDADGYVTIVGRAGDRTVTAG